MRKKYLSALLFGAILVTSAGTFTSCKDYDDEINNLQEQVDAVKASVADLEKKIDAGNWVTAVNDVEGGFEITFNDGKKYTIVNGNDGAAGQDGKPGTTWRINSENNNWEYSEDGGSTWKDTGICAKGEKGDTGAQGPEGPAGADGHSPYINEENGNWMIWDAEQGKFVDSEKSAIGAQTYIVEYNMYYELNVMQYVDGKPTEFTTVKLPKTATITNFEVVSIDKDGNISDFTGLTLNYGAKLTKDITFNGKTYKKGTYLVASTEGELSILVNPLDADATLYDFDLVDSKGNAPFVVTEVSENKTEKALSRANETKNEGAYDLTVTFAGNTDLDKTSGTYSLVTETINGKVASAYSVNVTSVFASDGLTITNPSEELVAGQSYDLKKYLEGPIVDCTFEIADKTIADKYGIKIEDNKIIATNIPVGTKVKDFGVKVKALMVAGVVSDGQIYMDFTYAVPGADALDPVVWTINTASNKDLVYISIDDIKSQLGVSSDAEIANYGVALGDFTWADGSELNSKTVEVNGKKYGKGGTSFGTLSGIFPVVTNDIFTLKNNNYSSATNINENLYIKFDYDALKAFPGEFATTVKFKNANGDVMIEVPVKVTTVAPDMSIVKLDNYFDGNNAVAYGSANGTNVTFDLNNLFKTENLVFAETEYKDANKNPYAPWLSSDVITVPVYKNASNADHFLGVYATREYTAKLSFPATGTPNPYVQNVEYKFNMTVKSELFEGTFTSNFTSDIINDLEIPVNAFDLKDVKGMSYYLADTYTTDKDGKLVKVGSMDSRIKSATRIIEAADDNAANYLEITKDIQGGNGKSAFFKVARKANVVLQQDTQCKLKVSFEDNWGRINSTEITVTLKKNA